MVAAEYEAVQSPMQLAESTDNELAVQALKDIADEECVYVGELRNQRKTVRQPVRADGLASLCLARRR
jgi:hypothetical protein